MNLIKQIKISFSFLLVLNILSSGYCQEEKNDVKKFVYDDHNKRDPMLRLVNSVGAVINYESELLVTDLVLEGIIYSPDSESFAVINAKVLKVGDKVGQFTISVINQRSIVLTKGNQRFELRLSKEE